MISIDCLGSHGENDYQQRATLWGDEAPTRESLRWSRRGQIAPYRFRQACQICEKPYYDKADITLGLFGQNIEENILVLTNRELARQIGLTESGWTQSAINSSALKRRQTIEQLVVQRRATRERLLGELQTKAGELAGILEIFESCTLCGACQEACPLATVSKFDISEHNSNTREYFAARLLDIASRSESCAGCGMCEAACHLGIPVLLITQMLVERTKIRQEILSAFGERAAV